MEPVKVLVVDDSALMRRIIKDAFSSDSRFQVVAIARDGVDALEKIVKFRPGLVTLDVEMPRLNGLETLKQIVRRFDIPVIMLSSQTREGSQVTLEALSLGAVDFIAKPELPHGNDRQSLQQQLLAKAAVAAHVKVQAGPLPVVRKEISMPKTVSRSAAKVVAIGSSTGGPRALETVLLSLPQSLPAAVLVTQHMPPKFTMALAERLNKSAELYIKEAEQGEQIMNGVAYIAPGDYHLEVSANKTIRLTQSPPVQHVRPSATVMMLSAAEVYGSKMVGVILTGMGKDGADGMVEIKRQGGSVLAQNEETSVIFSMPKAAIMAGAADQVLPLEKIAAAIISLCGR